ncbi:MAG: hypothetical protein K2O67_06055 [Clostridia bacterium]|nr:hypothetical protein [Clostridia bacterium]
MPREKCKVCGEPYNTAFYICPYCGVKKADEELLKQVDIAYNADDSAAARRFYNGILARDRRNAEAYWGLFLLNFGVKDGIFNEGIANVRVTAENYLSKNLTEELYDSIVLNENYLRAISLAEGDFKKRIDSFKNSLEERLGEIKRERTDQDFKSLTEGLKDFYTPSPEKADETFDFVSTHEQSSKSSVKSAHTAPKRKPGISAGKCVVSIVCCLPVIVELLIVLLIPHIEALAENAYVSMWGWQELSVPLKIAFLSLIVLGFLIQLLGLFGKINKPLGMVTQIISFGLFVVSAYAARNNAESVFTQWGLAMIVPVSLLVTALRYMSADGFGFIDDFNFWYFLPIALEVAEYILFFLLFPLIYGASATLWFFVALTVTTVGSIAVSSFWENMHWAPVGINFAVAGLLILVYWLGQLFSSEWMWNGGIILVVVLAIGASWFIHWFIHRNDI